MNDQLEARVGGRRGINVRDTVAAAATRVLLLSAAFRCALSDGDEQIAAIASAEAVGLLNHLSLTIRREQDAKRDNELIRNEAVGHIIDNAAPALVNTMLTSHRLPDQGQSKPLMFRDSLNKIAHFDPECSTFRIDGTFHLIYLSGPVQDKKSKNSYLAEINVRTLAETCLRAL